MKKIITEENFIEGVVSFEKGESWIKPWRLPFAKLKLFPPEDGIVESLAALLPGRYAYYP